MNNYKVRFIKFGVEFNSQPTTEELAKVIVKQMHDKGDLSAQVVEIAKQF